MNNPSDKLLNTLDMFVQSTLALARAWDEADDSDDLYDDYPFTDSWDEVVDKILRWQNTSIGARNDADSFRLNEAAPELLRAAKEALHVLRQLQKAQDDDQGLYMELPWPAIGTLDRAIKRTQRP